MDRIRFGSVPVFGRQKRDMPTLRLSPHSIALFRQCKLQYKFRYIDKLGEQYGKARPYFTMANHVHAALHDLFSSVSPEERTVEAGRQLLMNNWRRYRVGFKDKGDERRWAQRALNEITRFIVEQDITSTPLMLETPIETEITPGLILQLLDEGKRPAALIHITC